jgi:hypothetical protein
MVQIRRRVSGIAIARSLLASKDTLVGVFIGFFLFWTLKAWTRTTTTTTISSQQQNSHGNNQNGPVTAAAVKVAFAVSVTGCGSDPITEGGAILQHSIHRASSRGTLGGRYDYVLYAIFHPDAESCALPLQDLGYILLKRNTPVAVKDIQGEFLRSRIESNGCCGEKELIKFEAYTLTEYPIVVHLDLDVVVLKPLDDLFDMMLGIPIDPVVRDKIIMWKEKPIPKTINAFYTVDYNMVPPFKENKPVQGGFLVTRPSMNVYEEYKSIVKKGNFLEGGGWDGKVGPFHGSMTFQGLLPYYYNILHPGQAVELNRCVYNQMADNPRTEKTVDNVVHGNCRTGEDSCMDCREAPVETVVTTHFTLCQKPWWCLQHSQENLQHRLCRDLTREWYRIRSELEQSWGRPATGPGDFDPDVFQGFCSRHGKTGYIPIEKPYSRKIKKI